MEQWQQILKEAGGEIWVPRSVAVRSLAKAPNALRFESNWGAPNALRFQPNWGAPNIAASVKAVLNKIRGIDLKRGVLRAKRIPKSMWTKTMGPGWKKPMVRAGAAAAAVGTGAGLVNLLTKPDDISAGDINLPTDAESTPGAGEVLAHAAGGGALGGLGSLLYGKLKDKPDLQRDVIMALVGAAAGGAIPFMKTGAQEKEGIAGETVATLATIAAILGATGWGTYEGRRNLQKQKKMMEQQTQALAAIERAKLQEAAKSRKTLSYGTIGALGGGSLGGTLSNLYGKKTGKKSLRRDVLSALGGAGLGGAAGVLAANQA